MTFSRVVAKTQGKYQRASAQYLSRRPLRLRSEFPIVSFSFDDFPRSALLNGGRILRGYGVAGTYYACLGLIGKEIETGEMLLAEDVSTLLAEGHELGCHTFDHSHAWNTDPGKFEEAISKNRDMLEKLGGGTSLKSLSYPIGVPRPQTKRIASRHFACCRGGGQAFNIGTVDLNYLSAYFLEQSRDDPERIRRIIDENAKACGWLIFATHDVAEQPTPWGCTPRLFRDVVKYAAVSGATILPVFKAYEYVLAQTMDSAALKTRK